MRAEGSCVELLGKAALLAAYMVAHALWYKQTYTYFGILEALSGGRCGCGIYEL